MRYLTFTHPKFRYTSTLKRQINKSISKTLSTTDEISTNEKDDIRKHNATKIYKSKNPKQKALFPWRHSTEALGSFEQQNAEMNALAKYGIRIFASYIFFEVPLWKSICSILPIALESSTSQSSLWLSSQLSFLKWDHELTQMFALAFGKAVSSMIHNTYHGTCNIYLFHFWFCLFPKSKVKR